jgi:hypothetical protein
MAGKETVKGTFGNESIELNNAATEATLMAMLKLAQKDSQVLAQMAKQAGIDAKKIEESLEKSQNSGSGGGGGFGLLGSAANLAGGFLMDMVGSIGKTIGNLVAFSDALFNGTARTSDFMKAFKDLPLGIGHFASLLGAASKYFEKNLDSYVQIAQSGAGLATTMSSIRFTALTMGLSLDQFTQVFAKNQDVLSRLGATGALGAKNLVAINQQLINSRFGGTLMGLGYSFEQINNMVGDYIKATGDSIKYDRDLGKEQARLTKAAGDYGKELDFLSKLTGESREAIQKKLEADNAEASWQSFVSGLSDAQRDAAKNALARARMLGDKGAVDTIKAMFMGFAGPFSQEGQTYTATMGEGTRVLRQMVTAAMSATETDNHLAEMNKLFARGAAANIKDLDKFKNSIYAMGQGSEGGAKALLDITTAMNTYRSKHLDKEADILAEIIKLQQHQLDNAAEVEAQEKRDLALKRLGAQLQAALLPILQELSTVAGNLQKKLLAWLQAPDHIEKLKNAVDTAAKFIDKVFSDPEAAWKQIVGWFKGMLADMLDAMIDGPFGEAVFGDARDRLRAEGQVERLKNLDMAEYKALKNREAMGERGHLTTTELEKIKEMDKIIADGRKGLQTTLKIQEDKLRSDAFVGAGDKEAAEYYQKQWHMSAEQLDRARANPLGETNRTVNARARQNDDVLRKQADEMQKSREAIEKGNTSVDDLLKMIPGRATGSQGARVEDWGRESLVKLHGKEAVLTEEQMNSLGKSGTSGSGSTIELADLKIVAEGIISLNRQAAMQNKILNQMVENQRTMINRSTGNRLMV